MAKIYIDGDWDDADRVERESAEFLKRVGRGAVAAATRVYPGFEGKVEKELAPRASQAWNGLVELPTINDSVDGPLLKTLATVSNMYYTETLKAIYEPSEEGKAIFDTMTPEAPGASALNVFRKALKSYGTVVDGILDWHFEDAIPPFAALVVKPEDGKAPILIFTWRGSDQVLDFINDAAFSPTLSPIPTLTLCSGASRWSGETKDIRAHGGIVNLVEHSLSLHEDAIVGLIEKHKVERAFFTGHSLGGGLANVAHLVVRGQLKKAGSPWARLDGKVTWLACTFAALQTVVRLYTSPEKKPSLIDDVDESSYNIVYGCDPVPRAFAMLNFIGEVMETVVPKIISDRIPIPGILKWVFQLEDRIGGLVDGIVEKLKEDGLVGIMGHFTHVGTVVYKENKDTAFVHLKGTTAIRKQLDIKGDAFNQLWGEPDEYAESLLSAHQYFQNFCFGAPVMSEVTVVGRTDLTYLSCWPDGTVRVWNDDDGSGRQAWQFEKTGVTTSAGEHVYTIKVSGGTHADDKFLSTSEKGQVDLWYEDDESGRQRWELVNVGADTYYIKVHGGTRKGEVFLSSDFNGGSDIFLHHEDNGHQQWRISNLASSNARVVMR